MFLSKYWRIEQLITFAITLLRRWGRQIKGRDFELFFGKDCIWYVSSWHPLQERMSSVQFSGEIYRKKIWNVSKKLNLPKSFKFLKLAKILMKFDSTALFLNKYSILKPAPKSVTEFVFLEPSQTPLSFFSKNCYHLHSIEYFNCSITNFSNFQRPQCL